MCREARSDLTDVGSYAALAPFLPRVEVLACRACRAPVMLTCVADGRWALFDAEPRAGGGFAVVERRDGMTCPTCGHAVVVGELHRGGHVLFASFEEAVTSSAYLALPGRVTQLVTVFVASEFGSFRIHHCRDALN